MSNSLKLLFDQYQVVVIASVPFPSRDGSGELETTLKPSDVVAIRVVCPRQL